MTLLCNNRRQPWLLAGGWSVIPVTPHAQQTPDELADSDRPELEDYTSYEDDDALVICDTKNPRAWIRSEDRTDLQR